LYPGYGAQAALDATAQIVVAHALNPSHARQAEEVGTMAKQMSAQEANWQAMFAPAGDTDVEAYPKADRSAQAGSSILRAEIDGRGEVIRANNITFEQ
jgi:hypothetical protein